MTKLDDDVEKLVLRYGITDVLAALARHVNSRGMNPTLFRRINAIYEWLTEHTAKRDNPGN